MGITPTHHLHVPKRGVQSQGSYIHCPSLCSRSSIPGGKDLYCKQIAEKIMEEQLVMALVSLKQLCRLTCTNICTIGGTVGKPQLPGLPTFRRHRSWEKRQSYRFTLEPAEKRADTQVLVLGFSQAPLSTSCMPQPLGLALSCPAACSTSTQTPSPQGLVLLA